MINAVTYQALRILQDAGDEPLVSLSTSQPFRPSTIIAALQTQRSIRLQIIDDIDGVLADVDPLPTTASAEDEVLSGLSDDYSKLWSAVGELTPKQRQVIYLMYWRGLDSEQASEVLSCTGQNVRLHHKKAIARLREALHVHI